MTEILVVIGLIVLILGLAVPAFNLIRGGRSIDSAQNQTAAMIGKARSDAIGLQQIHGVMFFLDPATDRVSVAEVYATDYPDVGGDRDVYLDLVPDTEFLPLPPGVLAFVLCNGTIVGGNRTSDGYIGYNTNFGGTSNLTGTTGGIATGGVILFNGDGQLISRSYGYRTVINGTNTAMQTQIVGLVGAPNGFVDAGPNGPTTTIMSAMGFALCDYAAFKNNGAVDDPLLTGTAYSTNEANEETWIDDNSSQLIINRYNGTLTQAD